MLWILCVFFLSLFFSSQVSDGSVIGLWEGKYDCSQGVTKVYLKILEATPTRATAIFRFSADSSNPGVPTGCFSMGGTYDPKAGSLDLKGGEWILRPKGYFTVDFLGTVDPLGTKFSGAVIGGGCRSFHLVKAREKVAFENDECGISTDSIQTHRLAGEINQTLLSVGVIDLDIPFDFAKSTLQPAAKGQLDELGRTLSRVDGSVYKVRIYGHTDTVGTKESNLSLSRARADAVVAYLVKTFGISKSQFETGGFGATRLKNKADGSAPENRRVEVKLAPIAGQE